MSKLRQRTRQLIYAGLAGAAVMGVVFAGYAVVSTVKHHKEQNLLKKDYQQQLVKLEQSMVKQQQDMKEGWVLARNIGPGQTILPQDLIQVRLPANMAPLNSVLDGSKNGIAGKTTKIELQKGTTLTESMLYQAEPTSSDLRNRELRVIALPSNLKQGDVVDVRVQFPTGQDYIILSKKKIDKLLNPVMWITLTEQEILSLSSALVDAYLHDASLYALTYVEPELQDKALPTYPVNKEVLQLIASDPNIVKKAENKLSASIRLSLENDLARFSPNQSASNHAFSTSSYAPSSTQMPEQSQSQSSSSQSTANEVSDADRFNLNEAQGNGTTLNQTNVLTEQALEDEQHQK